MLIDRPTDEPEVGSDERADEHDALGPTHHHGQRLAIAAIASVAAGVMHAAAAGIHADHPALARLFVAVALAQGAVAVLGFLRDDRLAADLLVWVNLVALAGWITTRLSGIEWFDGLEVAERPQLADTIAALLAAVAVVAAVAGMRERALPASRRAVGNAALLAGLLLVPGLVDATSHDHADGHDSTGTATGDGSIAVGGQGGVAADDGHADDGHGGEGASTDAHSDAAPTGGGVPIAQPAPAESGAWPRAWDPQRDAIDFSGVAGVSDEQQARAEQLVRDSLRELQAFADVSGVGELGYESIGDASTGFEHFVNYDLIADGVFLDPTQPESLVFRVDGAERTLVSAMFIAGERPVDDPELVDFGGPLMQWHVHENLCWGLGPDGEPKVLAVLEQPGDACPDGTVNAGGENPMVHVWVTPHECGPFAALEGHGAGQVDPSAGERADQCAHDDGHADTGHASELAARPFDPSQPIDLGGIAGVSPEQQAFAENLVAATIRDLPQWADVATAEAAGFRSIGDAATGHEHFINWEWIDDEVWLDPDAPESLVYARGPNGRELVAAMFMLPSDVSLDDVPDFGGELMQWHIHADLCFTAGEEPTVVGVKPVGGTCRAPSVDGTEAPMVHVWITPNECGPFAPLGGIGGGQVKPGETVVCSHDG
jgi:hypothetical protein